ncbi:hypothetical protein CISIN_1g041943mg [Citrus sinensis]|uniref:Uncharacterized protein n=1 Tax=Citrus sinensis TaxID=2711 RepID=A0A067EK10_CITSI|nr:hypothetical protein CISIN_1g041943mg [Citrus sinensis]
MFIIIHIIKQVRSQSQPDINYFSNEETSIDILLFIKKKLGEVYKLRLGLFMYESTQINIYIINTNT